MVASKTTTPDVQMATMKLLQSTSLLLVVAGMVLSLVVFLELAP
jgi:hypothetical protein